MRSARARTSLRRILIAVAIVALALWASGVWKHRAFCQK
jgi:hypothetical protein